jgi:hypothetical protein
MGTGDPRRDDGAPGGVAAITRPAVPPQPRSRPRRPPDPPGPRGPRGPRDLRDLRGSRAAREDDALRRRGGERDKRGGERDTQSARRMPFFVLLCGLLGGALVSALVISTTLAQGAFEITRLQQSNDALAKQRQILQQEVAVAQSAQVIEQRALRLGLRPVGELRFIDLKTGTTATDAGSGAVAAIHVPGYTP